MTDSSWLATRRADVHRRRQRGNRWGIKVTTFGMLAFIIWAQWRGLRSVDIGHRRLPADAPRQVVVLTMLSASLIAVSVYALLLICPYSLDQLLFEVVSAFGTVGLSTGIPPGFR